MYRD
jgi:hypothetical protein